MNIKEDESLCNESQKRPGKLDISTVKSLASGRWIYLIPALSSCPADILDSSKHPCPKCGGTDRFRAYDDFNQEGGLLCSQCFPPSKSNADGFAALQWLNNWTFAEALRAVAERLGVVGGAPNKASEKINGAPNKASELPPKIETPKKIKPAADSELEFLDWNDQLIRLWCMRKAPITPEALKRFGARRAKYKNKIVVIALPIFGKDLDKAEPVGWIIYNITGGTLPSKDGPVGKRLTFGSQTGLVGMVDRLGDKSALKIKTEGPTDALALLAADINTSDAIFCNACGAIERPDKEEFAWLPSLVADSRFITVGDADNAGVEGAKRWANFFAAVGESRIATLPYEVIPSHGKDLRNWIANGGSREDFEALVGDAIEYSSTPKTDNPEDERPTITNYALDFDNKAIPRTTDAIIKDIQSVFLGFPKRAGSRYSCAIKLACICSIKRRLSSHG